MLRATTIESKTQISLNLLKVVALSAALKVLTLLDQKLIKKNEVIPISSQPKKSITKLPEKTKSNILFTKSKSKKTRRSVFSSPRK